MHRQAWYWLGVSLLSLVLLSAGTLVGVGLSYLAAYRQWSPLQCTQLNRSLPRLIVGPNSSHCPSPLWAAIIPVNHNLTALLADPSSFQLAAAAAAAWPNPSEPFLCYQATRATSLSFPSVCETCNLECQETPDLWQEPIRIQSASLVATQDFALLLVTIGAPICGGFIVALVVFLIVCRLRQDHVDALIDANEGRALANPTDL